MTVRRLVLTVAAMAAMGMALRALAPSPAETVAVLGAPQQSVDAAGAGALVLALVGGLAWLMWAWGCLGLALTAATALPGAVGWTARLALGAVFPAGARRGAAVVLGVGVALQTPLTAVTALAASSEVAATNLAVPDWPVAATVRSSPAIPDWPAQAPGGTHVVVRGDTLWDIAAGHLRTTSGRVPTDAEVAVRTDAWWSANRSVIGADPDVILPGQTLTPPVTP
jgi:nucleoid-associated protein YgaU